MICQADRESFFLNGKVLARNSFVPGGPVISSHRGTPFSSTVIWNRRNGQHCRSRSIKRATSTSQSSAEGKEYEQPFSSSLTSTTALLTFCKPLRLLSWRSGAVRMHAIGNSIKVI